MKSNQKINHLVFDMGGVLVQIDWHDKISQLLGKDIPFEQIHDLWGASKAVTAFENGQISFDAFSEQFIAEQNMSMTVPIFQQTFMSIVQDDMPGINELLAELQPHFTMSLLSNTNQPHYDMLVKRNTFLKYIDNPYTSLGFGVMKPEPEIYHKLIAALDCAPQEILFFDDGLANIEAALAIGINAERVFSTEDIEVALAKHGCWPL